MTVKSVIDVDINDEKFKAFLDLYGKYETALKEAPEKWGKVNAAMGDANGIATIIAATLLAQADAATALAAAQARAARTEKGRATVWAKFASSSKSLLGNVKETGREITKWVGSLTAIGGIVGVGSLFGLDKLAGNVSGTRRQSLGIGASYGETKAFKTDYGRLVDPDSFLGGVNEAVSDISKRWSLYGAGLSEKDINGKDTAQVGAALLAKIGPLLDATPDALLGQVLQSRGLDQFLSLQDARRLKATPAAERESLYNSFQSDSKSFGLDAVTQLKWQNFSTQLDRAGNKIEKVFVDGITPLIPSLGHLSDSVVKVIGSFLGAGDPERMKKVSDGIDRFATYIGSKEFADDVGRFVKNIGKLADGIGDVLEALGLWEKKNTGKETAEWNAAHPDKPKAFDDPNTLYNPNRPEEAGDKFLRELVGGKRKPSRAASRLLDESAVMTPLLAAIAHQESHGNPLAVGPLTKYGTAKGLFQFTDATAKQYGVDQFDPASSTKGAEHYVGDLAKRFGGDLRKVLAAYNWGPGNLSKDIRRNGANWEAHAPAETRDYINKIVGALAKKGVVGKSGNARVSIMDNTGGSVIVQQAQAAR